MPTSAVGPTFMLEADVLRCLEKASRVSADSPHRKELRQLLDTPAALDWLEDILRGRRDGEDDSEPW